MMTPPKYDEGTEVTFQGLTFVISDVCEMWNGRGWLYHFYGAGVGVGEDELNVEWVWTIKGWEKRERLPPSRIVRYDSVAKKRGLQMIEDKIRAAIIEALNGIPELHGCLPAEIQITTPDLAFHITFEVPLPIGFA